MVISTRVLYAPCSYLHTVVPNARIYFFFFFLLLANSARKCLAFPLPAAAAAAVAYGTYCMQVTSSPVAESAGTFLPLNTGQENPAAAVRRKPAGPRVCSFAEGLPISALIGSVDAAKHANL
ncbi:hypothetical protein F5Y10DRAFT_244377, partial [Nemania abortiva]